MMKRRLLLAKKLLNPKDSVLIVTIDEKEYLHLGCLLEELFPEARMQMVSDVINPSGSSRKDLFSRSEEYIFFVLFGEAKIIYNSNNMLYPIKERKARWDGLVRRGATGKRSARPNLFYPLFFNKTNGRFVATGTPLPKDKNRNEIVPPNGCFALFPISANGDEATWGVSNETFIDKFNKGFIRFGDWKPGTEFRTVSHLQEGMIAALNRGEIDILGKDEDGAYILGVSNKPVTPMTTWVQQSHSAGDFGTRLLKLFFPTARFSFPKSLYAVHDTIRFFVANKPNALIVDFFAGSGTTLHAVNLLNAEDGGNRRCIMVTNNEVSEQEAKTLTKQGFKPGDEEWERLGIARYVNWPRTVCSIEGHDVNGQPLKGEYLGTDHRQMKEGFESNCVFFKLDFLDKTQVALGRQFRELLPMLWMKAGAFGQCPQLEKDGVPEMLVLPENHFAVLTDEKSFGQFVDEVDKHEDITMIYLVVDSDMMYREMAKQFPKKQTCQLYRDYLDNFRINITR
jgi:adenine-specific DNA-methyltransferase